MSSEFIIGLMMTTALGCLSFFLVRFIGKHDDFEKNTNDSFGGLSKKITRQEANLKTVVKRVEAVLSSSGLDKQDKKRVNDLRQQVYDLRKTLKQDVVPMAKNMGSYAERIKTLEKQLESQERKLKVMYDSVKVLLERRSRPK